MADVLNVQIREIRGKRNARRMRRSGKMPAVLYGHGQDSLSLSLATDEITAAIRHGSKLLELRGSLNENAIIRELQWDAFGHDVLHVDLMRVQADERLEVEVAVETRGIAPGTHEGGLVQVLLHEVTIETLATAIPDRLHVNINTLGLGESLAAKDIEDLPAEAKLLTDPDTVIVHCVAQVEEGEEEAAEATAEPEVIGRKAAEEGEGKE